MSDRDFAIEFSGRGALAMVHVSRCREELVLWMSQNFGFIDLADRFCTGSSIMPQKKNPDVPELARGKTGRVVGHLMGLLTLMKGQPLAYNKDNQEDKEPLFDTVDTLKDTLRIFAELVAGIAVQAEAMERAALGLCDRDRPRRLPGEEGPAVPRRARGWSRARCATRSSSALDLARCRSRRCRASTPAIGADVQSVLTGAARSTRATSSAARRRRRCARRSRATGRASASAAAVDSGGSACCFSSAIGMQQPSPRPVMKRRPLRSRATRFLG